jgi:pimeloyl-ACP methyl ester carboxylesterase
MDTLIAPLFAQSNQESCQEAIQKMQDIGKATPQATVVGCLQAMRDRQDRTAVLQKATVPVLIIAGKEDPAVPLEATLQQCHLPEDSTVHFLGHVGHMGMFEKTTRTRAALVQFAETLSPANAQKYRSANSF